MEEDRRAYICVAVPNGAVLSHIASGATDLDRHVAMPQLVRHATHRR